MSDEELHIVLREDYQDPVYDDEEYILQTKDISLFSIRASILGILVLSVIAVLLNAFKFRNKNVKNWKLCLVCSACLFVWLTMSLYSNHIDIYWAKGLIMNFETRASIYNCVMDLFHGLTLFLTVLLLSHLSDFQRRGCWLILVSIVVIVPITYSVVVLLIDLYAKSRHEGPWSVAVVAFRAVAYNLLTTILLLMFSPRFCTWRLYGTYEEKRSPFAVLISRWIFSFLVLHNLIAISWAAIGIVIKLKGTTNLSDLILVQEILDEIKFFLIVIAVPVSYVVAILVGACCFNDEDLKILEMDKIDKIYEEVWRPERKPSPDVLNTSDSTSTNDSGVGGILRDPNPRKHDRKKRESYLEAMSNGSFDDDARLSVTSEPIDL